MTGPALAFLLLGGVDPFSSDLRLADLDPAAIALEEGAPLDPLAILDAFLEAGAAHVFDVGAVSVPADPRWYGVVAGGAEGDPPLVEVRRWPGDTGAAFFAIAPGEEIPIPEGRFGPPREGPSGWILREGTIDGARGPQRALWAERVVLGGTRRCGALLVPGDAGLGAESVRVRERELLALLSRVVLRDEGFERIEANPGERLALPRFLLPPRAWDERTDPWQTAEGPGFTIGVPPGIHARRLDGGVSPPRTVPDASMWLRGRFEDRDGETVAIGDGVRAGWVVEIRGADLAPWRRGERPPAPIPAARRVDRLALDRTAIEGTGARAGWASSWKEEGFAGDWIVFGLDFEDRGIELAFPLLSGRRSLALFRIPVSWRAAGAPPAPPPIDPASRFGIRFDPLSRSERARRGNLEGALHAPGVRLELPRGWWPVATLSSADGFPILLFDGEGNAAAVLRRLAAGEEVRGFLEAEGWVDVGGAKVRGAAAIRRRADGALYLGAHEGHGWVLEPAAASPSAWERLEASLVLGRIVEDRSARP